MDLVVNICFQYIHITSLDSLVRMPDGANSGIITETHIRTIARPYEIRMQQEKINTI